MTKKQLHIIQLCIGLILYLLFRGVGEKIPTSLPSPTPTVVQTLLPIEVATVSAVIDGDTIELTDKRWVRYIGIDTPETKHPNKGVECFGKESTQKNKDLVEGNTITMQRDVSETDKYKRLLRYVWVNDQFVNELLVREGYALQSTFPPDVRFAELFKEAAEDARINKRGLWNSCN